MFVTIVIIWFNIEWMKYTLIVVTLRLMYYRFIYYLQHVRFGSFDGHEFAVGWLTVQFDVDIVHVSICFALGWTVRMQNIIWLISRDDLN